jgi:hypothetical protein
LIHCLPVQLYQRGKPLRHPPDDGDRQRKPQ